MNRRGEALVEERPSARFPRSSLRRRRQNSIRSGGEVTSLGRTSPAWFSQEGEASERQSPSRHKRLDPTDNPSGPDNCAYRRSSEWRAGAVPLNRNVKSHEARVVDERQLCAKSRHCQVYAEPHHVDDVELIGLDKLSDGSCRLDRPAFAAFCWNPAATAWGRIASRHCRMTSSPARHQRD
jgi:hypothetical protein